MKNSEFVRKTKEICKHVAEWWFLKANHYLSNKFHLMYVCFSPNFSRYGGTLKV